MGLSVSVATAIIFSAVILVAADFVQTYDEVTDLTREAMEERGGIGFERSSTAVAISEVWQDGAVLRVNATNAGSSTIDPRGCDLIIDGTLATALVRWSETRVIGHPGSMVWAPGEAISISLDLVGASGRVMLVTGNGASAVGGVI